MLQQRRTSAPVYVIALTESNFLTGVPFTFCLAYAIIRVVSADERYTTLPVRYYNVNFLRSYLNNMFTISLKVLFMLSHVQLLQQLYYTHWSLADLAFEYILLIMYRILIHV